MRLYENIMDILVSYSYDVFKDITPQKAYSVRLSCEVIRQAMADLHSKDVIMQMDASRYFEGDTFLKHCEVIGVDDKLMLYIVNNPDKYLERLGVYESETGNYNESA